MEKLILSLMILITAGCKKGPVNMPFVVESQVLNTNAFGLPIWSVRLQEHRWNCTAYSISINPWFGMSPRFETGEHGSFDSFRAECIAKGDQMWLTQGADHLVHDHPLLLMDFKCDRATLLDSAYDPSWQRKVYTRFLGTVDHGVDTLFIFEWDGVFHHGYAHLGSHLIYYSKSKGFVGIIELCRDYDRTDTICVLGNIPGVSSEQGIDCVPCRCVR
jgi:hypothetical protein